MDDATLISRDALLDKHKLLTHLYLRMLGRHYERRSINVKLGIERGNERKD